MTRLVPGSVQLAFARQRAKERGKRDDDGRKLARDRPRGVCSGGGFFPAGQQADGDGQRKPRTGEDAEGEPRVGRNEIRAQCALLRSAPRPTVIREGPPIPVRPSRQGAPHSPVQMFPVGPATSRDECGAECVAGKGFFSAGRQFGRDGEGNGGWEKTRGGMARGPE